MDNPTDHDMIVRIDERVQHLIIEFKNHLRHHWMVDAAMLTTILGLVVKLLMKG